MFDRTLIFIRDSGYKSVVTAPMYASYACSTSHTNKMVAKSYAYHAYNIITSLFLSHEYPHHTVVSGSFSIYRVLFTTEKVCFYIARVGLSSSLDHSEHNYCKNLGNIQRYRHTPITVFFQAAPFRSSDFLIIN